MSKSKETIMNEHALSRKLNRELKKLPGVFAFKIHGSRYQSAGLPDWCILFRGSMFRHVSGAKKQIAASRTLFVELKSPKGTGELTELQKATHKKIEDASHLVMTATSVEEVINRMEMLGYRS